MALATQRLPGVRVDVAPPPAVEALPRMDVAVLVGFAATGPLHLPVAVGSVAQYRAVFGPDPALAWDAEHGERVFGQLGPAVRGFFSNGGRRCWVIRVARVASSTPEAGSPGAASAPPAQANRFAIPGLLELHAGGALRPALALARCEGSWSDGLRVASALQQRSLRVLHAASTAAGGLVLRTRSMLRAGDLLQVGDAARQAYLSVDAVRLDADASGPYVVACSPCAAFERLGPAGSPPLSLGGRASVEGFVRDVPASLDAAADAQGQVALQFGLPVPAALEPGHWVRWSDGSATVWLRIAALTSEPAFVGSPPALTTASVQATVRGPAWQELGAVLPLDPTDITRAHLLALDLQVAEPLLDPASLAAQGLTPAHPAAWWQNLADADFHRPPDDQGDGPATEAVPSELPRFPLARAAGALPLAWLPLGVEPLFGDTVGPMPQTLTALERDGLVPFDAGLFLDPELADAPMQDIAAIADAVRYMQQPTRTLRGLHAAWSLGRGGLFNEASLLAVPDAMHLGWEPRPPADQPPSAAPRDPAPAAWRSHRGPCAKDGGEPLDEPDFGVFLDCSTQVVGSPVLSGPGTTPPGRYRLSWTAVHPQALYMLLEAGEPDFGDARGVFHGPGTEHAVLNPRPGTYHYRVSAQVGDDAGAPSAPVRVVVRSDEWLQRTPAQAAAAGTDSQWLAVQRAALRMAAASGELFCALAMPRHFRTPEALRHVASLRALREPPDAADPAAFGTTERLALSYGAMYFPWLQADARTGLDAAAPRLVSPDGVALGVLAARASRRGAWIAAANEPLKDVVALAPAVPAHDWQSLQDAQVNLLRSEPRGLLALSADTLALDSDVRPINVRRLLTLLRRLALRRGVSYVFEPHGPALRRALERGFGALLGELFRRGAFAGSTAQQSYRVVVDDTLNSAADAEAGRFIVELRVAPSLPMRFISVLLAQGGARLTVTEEL
jgi:hypothetical protein